MFCKSADSDSLVEILATNVFWKEGLFRERNEDMSPLLMNDTENNFYFDNENHLMTYKNPASSLYKGASSVERLFVHAKFRASCCWLTDM